MFFWREKWKWFHHIVLTSRIWHQRLHSYKESLYFTGRSSSVRKSRKKTSWNDFMKFMKYGNLYELCFMNIWNLLGLVNSLFHESFLLWNLFYEISIFIWYLYLIEKSDFGLEFPTNLKDFYRKEDFSKSCLFHEKTQFIGLVNLVSWNSWNLLVLWIKFHELVKLENFMNFTISWN